MNSRRMFFVALVAAAVSSGWSVEAQAVYRTYVVRPAINNDAILEGEALPAVCLHISTDGGVNWDEGTIIDYPASFNGAVIEVEPDVVLVVYPESMGEIRPSFVRAQRIGITPEGPVAL